MKSLDIIVPFYNEKSCLGELFSRLTNLRKNFENKLDVRFIFINDGSTDGSALEVERFAGENKHAKLISFSRNFGQEMAVTAGLDYSDGDFVAIIDSDLQDAPELLVDMYEILAGKNLDVVYGQRRKRKSETVFKRLTAYLFYRVLNLLCNTEFPEDTGNFRIMKGLVRDSIKGIREHNRFTRGILAWSGFQSEPFFYDRDERKTGITKYSIKSMMCLATNAIFSFSKAPLTAIWGISAILLIFAIIFLLHKSYIISSIFFVGFAEVFVTAIIGQYIIGISEDTKKRPLYIVDKTMNI